MGAPALRTPGELAAGIARTLRRRWIAALLCFALTIGAALAVTLGKATEYSATAQILLAPSDAVGQLVNPGSLPSPANAQRDVDTNARLITAPPVLDRVRARLGSSASDEELASKVEVDGQADSSLVSITVTDASAGAARRLAGALAQEYRDFRRSSAQDAVRQAIAAGRERLWELRRAGAPDDQRSALRARLAELETNAAVTTGGVQIVHLPGVAGADGAAAPAAETRSGTLAEAASESASVPGAAPAAPGSETVPGAADAAAQDNLTPRRLALTLLAAGFVGALLAVGGAFALEALDRRLLSAGDVEAAFGVPVLGWVPASGRDGEAPDPGAYADLVASLGFVGRGGGPRTLMLSPASGDVSASAMAGRLATQLASSGRRVLVIDANLAGPAVAATGASGLRRRQAAAPGSRRPGLAQILAGETTLADEVAVVHVVPASAPARGATGDVTSYELLGAGQPVDNPAALLGRPVLATTMRDARARADVVLLEAGTPVPVSRSAPLAMLSEGILLLAKARRTTDADARAARHALGPLYDRVIGVVLESDRPVATRRGLPPAALAAAIPALPAHVATSNGTANATNGSGAWPPAGPGREHV